MIALLVSAVIFIAILWGLSESAPRSKREPGPTDVERAYIAGDAEVVAAGLPLMDAVRRLPLLVALGRYRQAVEFGHEIGVAVEIAPASSMDGDEWLNRINLAEAFVELGQWRIARACLEPIFDDAGLLFSAGRCALGWLLTTEGDHVAAFAAMEGVRPADLMPQYAAEAELTLALILINLGRLEEAEQAIDACRRLTMRASTERNLLLHEARWQLLSGKLEDAEKTFIAARDHRWKRQGGSGFLALGDAFRDAGRPELARECWTLSAQQDPESASAQTARDRLARNAEVPS